MFCFLFSSYIFYYVENFTLILCLQVLKKADMIRKNAVESILAERDILISVRNPFVVSTCSSRVLPCLEKHLFHSNMNCVVSGSFLLFFYLPRKFVSCDGVSKWRRSLLIVEKFRLLRRGCCSCIYSGSGKNLHLLL